jgi:signal transduction histidine kinase
VQDVTEQRLLEERFRRSQKLEAIGRLAGGVAHDFNNLLVVIKGYTNMILSEIGPQSPLYDAVQEVFKAGERASALTRQLLAFSGRRVMSPQPVNLNSLIRDLEKMLSRIVNEDIEIKSTLSPSVWMIRADVGQIEQVITNLVVNARDAMQGGGVLTISTSNVQLNQEGVRRLSDLIPGKYVRLSVCDTGTGMSPETQRRIFEPFFTTKLPGEGTGLGLSTVYGIARQHGGDVSVHSELGRGSVFSVYLPAIDETEVDATPAQREQPASGGTETILLVEDEESVRKLSVRMLQRQGYNVIV